MKTVIPEELKREVPANRWGKIMVVTPVVMTVIATLLAGLASSEMTRAQYDRSYGAQLQSKAGDQWGYFQAKKLRAAMQRTSLELLGAIAEVSVIRNPTIDRLPEPAPFHASQEIEAAMRAVEQGQPESEVTPWVMQVPDAALVEALRLARSNAVAYEVAFTPAMELMAEWEKAGVKGDQAVARQLAATRFRVNGTRYEGEARLNQVTAGLIELQVRKANLSADRHRRRSMRFFIGMLAAQAAVIIATLAIAASKRNLLWSVAASAGVTAVAFAIYVYLKV